MKNTQQLKLGWQIVRLLFQQCQVQVLQQLYLRCSILWPSSQTGNKGSAYFKYVEVQDEPSY